MHDPHSCSMYPEALAGFPQYQRVPLNATMNFVCNLDKHAVEVYLRQGGAILYEESDKRPSITAFDSDMSRFLWRGSARASGSPRYPITMDARIDQG